MTVERRFKLSEEDLKEIIRGYIVRKMGDDCVVKDMKFEVGTAFYDDVPKVSCKVKIEIPVLTLPL